MLRDELGRFVCSFDEYWLEENEEEVWKDEKCYDVVFPNHGNEKLNGDVVTYSIDELENK